MNSYLWLALISMSPLVELRGAIPLGIALGLNPLTVFITCVLSNILVIPILFFILTFFFGHLSQVPILGKLLLKAMDRAHRKVGKYVDKYGPIGLALFVAIPLPVTGAWTGCLGAFLLKIDKKKAMPAIAVGVVIAGILVTLASLGVLTLFRI